LHVFKYPNTFLLFLIPGSLVGSVLTFAGLWGVPYLVTHHGLSTPKAAALTSAHLIAWAVAGPLFGWFSDRLEVRKPLLIIGCAVSLCGGRALVFISPLPRYGLIALLLVTGFSSGCMIISFAFAKESVPVHLSGTISGVINMGIMTGPMILQPAVGWVLDHKWQGRMAEGVRLYGLEAYQAGFSLMIAWTVLALVLLFFTRETGCRQLN
jgi:MFS family permease